MPRILLILLALALLMTACSPAINQQQAVDGISLKVETGKTVTIWFSPGGENPPEDGKVEKIADVTGPAYLSVEPNRAGIYVHQFALDSSADWYRVKTDAGLIGWVDGNKVTINK